MPEGELVEWYVAGGGVLEEEPPREGSERAQASVWVREAEQRAAGAGEAEEGEAGCGGPSTLFCPR